MFPGYFCKVNAFQPKNPENLSRPNPLVTIPENFGKLNVFTSTIFYTNILLHRQIFAQRGFYTHNFLHHIFLFQDVFTYTTKFLQQQIFTLTFVTPTNFCTDMFELLGTNTHTCCFSTNKMFTPTRFFLQHVIYANMRLHQQKKRVHRQFFCSDMRLH